MPLLLVSAVSVLICSPLEKNEHSMFNMKNTSNVIEFDILLFYIM